MTVYDEEEEARRLWLRALEYLGDEDRAWADGHFDARAGGMLVSEARASASDALWYLSRHLAAVDRRRLTEMCGKLPASGYGWRDPLEWRLGQV